MTRHTPNGHSPYSPTALNGGQPSNLHDQGIDPARLSFLDVASACDTATGKWINIDVMGVADPHDPWVRVGTLRFSPDDARALAHSLIVCAAAADSEFTATD
jgi:hypothetical protein